MPVGVLLSGGLDSSLLVGLLADQVPDLRTFSIGFEDLGAGAEKADEFEFSDQIAAHFNTRHHKYSIANSEVMARLPEAVAQMTEPMVSHDVIAFYLLAERVSKDVKVVMSGQGADEVFGGYFWYPDMDAASGTPLERFSQHYFDRDHSEYLQMIAPAFQVGDVTSELIASELGKPQADEFLDQVWRLDATTLIVDDPVKRVDNMPMAWGLEVRTPFLDHELVQLAARMPPGLKLKEGGKFPLKAISRGLIPDCGHRPAQRLLSGAGAQVCARPVPGNDARHLDVGGLPQARPVPARLRGQTAGRAGSARALHPHQRQQTVAPGVAGMVAAGACGPAAERTATMNTVPVAGQAIQGDGLGCR